MVFKHLVDERNQKIPFSVTLMVQIMSNSSLLQAEEITLTIGQAFDLAYKKFLESGGKDVETRKQIGSLQKRVCFLSHSLFEFIYYLQLQLRHEIAAAEVS